ncbi:MULTISPECIES: bacteriohemerythrin [Methylococcus]|uniref:Bacteriohemerythrin n=1 Tax=Methylococcus capsulatus TaxID=414 RepID=A0ABZ2F339_METCP|nr:MULTISPECIES: bacteriohemerythrin [Methylococcus]MDF9391385.1 bacteriohemerythrin [Methylococcus capsulatus]
MALMTWTAAEFGTNVGFADDQHKTIFDMVNKLHDTAATGNRAEIGKQLDALIDYVVMHFKSEETEMQKKDYADFAAHKAEHDKLVGVCADLQKKFHAGEAEVNQDTTRFVRDWLVNHIPKVDKLYGPCLSA